MTEFVQTLSPLEERGITTITGFGKELYIESKTQFTDIEFKGRLRDVNVKDKLVRTIVAFDSKQVETVEDLLDIPEVETTVEVSETEKKLKITSEIVVSSILTQHESYSNTHDVVMDVQSEHSQQELYKLVQICSNLLVNI